MARGKVSKIKSYDLASTMDNTTSEWDVEQKATVDNATLKTMFYSEDWVFICVDLIAQEISNVPLKVMRKVITDGKVNYQPAETHPLQKLLNQPNKYQGQSAFLYCEATEFVLMGNSINWYSKSKNELYSLPTEQVTIDFNNAGEMNNYLYTPDSVNFATKANYVKLPLQEIMHIRRPNPNSLLWGLSPFIPGKKSILFNRYSQEYLLAFYQKGATPQIALSMDVNASEQSVTRMLRSFELAYSGRKNQRRTMLLPKGVTAQPFNISIADQKLIDIININREVIINILRIPKHALSIADTGSLGSEEYKQALKYFWSATIMPTQQKMEESYNQFFKEQLGTEYVIKFDNSDVSILKDDELKKAQIAKEMLQTHTINEVRAKVYDMPAFGGADVIISLQPSQQPMGFNQPLMQAPTNITPLEQLPGRVEQVNVQNEIDPEIEANHSFIKVLTAKYAEHFKREKETVDGFENSTKPKLVKSVLNIFEKQLELAIKEVSKELNRVDYAPTKSLQTKAKPSLPRLKREIKDALESLEEQYQSEVTEPLYAGVDLGYQSNMGLIFNEENQAAIEAMQADNESKTRKILLARGLQTFAKISDTTTERIMQVVEQGLKDQLTLQDIAKNIAKDFKQISPSRAQTIARTEALTAVSLGQAAMLDNAKEVLPDIVKVWLTADDERVRGNPNGLYPNSKADHWHLNGEKTTADGIFKNGLRFPRDPRGDAAEVINCRCRLIAISKQDIDSLELPKPSR